MPSQFQRGQTFVDGGSGTAAQFHALIESARILPGAISEQVAAAPAAGDYFMFLKDGNLKKATLQQIINAFPRGGDASVFAMRKLGTQAGTAAAGNDARFPAHLSGIRKANNNSPDTVAGAADLSPDSVNLAQTTQIDWDAGDVFYSTLTGDKTYTFANARNGRVITVALKLQGHTVTWPTLLGAVPTINASATVHYFSFIKTPLGVSGTVVAL